MRGWGNIPFQEYVPLIWESLVQFMKLNDTFRPKLLFVLTKIGQSSCFQDTHIFQNIKVCMSKSLFLHLLCTDMMATCFYIMHNMLELQDSVDGHTPL